MPEPVINDAVRTPIFALGCAISAVRTDDLVILWVGIGHGVAMIVEWLDDVP